MRTLSVHSSLSILSQAAQKRFSFACLSLVDVENETEPNLLKLISCLSIGIVIAEIFEQNTQFLPLTHCSPGSRNMFFQPDPAKDARGVCVWTLYATMPCIMLQFIISSASYETSRISYPNIFMLLPPKAQTMRKRRAENPLLTLKSFQVATWCKSGSWSGWRKCQHLFSDPTPDAVRPHSICHTANGACTLFYPRRHELQTC